MVLHQIDKVNPLLPRHDHHKLTYMLDMHSLVDAYRSLHPFTISYSYSRKNTASRIDRIYISRSIEQDIQQTSYMPLSFSDHASAHSITLKSPWSRKDTATLLTPAPKRIALWKLNQRLLSIETIKRGFKMHLESWIESSFTLSDPLMWWEKLKKRFKNYFQIHDRLEKHKTETKTKNLQAKLNNLQSQEEIHEALKELKLIDTIRLRQ